MNQIITTFQNITVRDIIDILLVTVVLFAAYTFFRETRAQQLVKGIIIIFVFSGLANVMNLYTINWMLSGAIAVGGVLSEVGRPSSISGFSMK